MPVVPSDRRSQAQPTGPQPTQQQLLMALATMHDLGRLNPNEPTQVSQKFDPDPKPQSLSDSVYQQGEIRINPNSLEDPKDKEFLKNLPSDIEREDLNEFGKGHENNTIKLRLKKPAYTS